MLICFADIALLPPQMEIPPAYLEAIHVIKLVN